MFALDTICDGSAPIHEEFNTLGGGMQALESTVKEFTCHDSGFGEVSRAFAGNSVTVTLASNRPLCHVLYTVTLTHQPSQQPA